MTKSTLNVGIIGASGYTGGELLRLLAGHPQVRIACVTAEKSAGTSVAALFPSLHTIVCHDIEATHIEDVAKRVDAVFLALPHTKSMEPVSHFVQAGKIVLDLSADFRLRDPAVYKAWYQATHTRPDLLAKVVYGLPELHKDQIQQSHFVAVPGCYPTAALLQLAPLLTHKVIDPDSIIIDAKSGISGAGRSPALLYHFPEAHESVKAYKIGEHRHIPEIEQELHALMTSSGRATGAANASAFHITFTPHIVPMNRGILSTAYAQRAGRLSLADIRQAFKDDYHKERFIRLHEDSLAISPAHVRGSNFCDIAVFLDERTDQVVSVAALDNLVKGAAGQAIQAMNLMVGYPEDLGLTSASAYP